MKYEYDIIRSQHKEIFTLINCLRKTVKKHIVTENELLEYRSKKKPDTHIDIDDKILRHKEQHEMFIRMIDKLESSFEKHIKIYDQVHIHKL